MKNKYRFNNIVELLKKNQADFVPARNRVGKRNAWRCTCGAETWALRQDEAKHLVAEHLKPSGETCEKSKTVQEETRPTPLR